MLEFALEVGAANDCIADIADRLADYAALSPEAIHLAGADRMPNRRPVLVPS